MWSALHFIQNYQYIVAGHNGVENNNKIINILQSLNALQFQFYK